MIISTANLAATMRVRGAFYVAICAALCALQSACTKDASARSEMGAEKSSRAGAVDPNPVSYAGTDAHGIPRYVNRTFTSDERAVLRHAFGIVSPSHIYLSDSTDDGVLKYDPAVKRCGWCYVDSFRIGFVSVRKPGETWDDLVRRVKRMRRPSFAPSSLVTSSSVSALDPDIQPEVTEMLATARRAGFALRIVSTYRSPQLEALLMAEGHGRTFTLTSLHSYGRAIDIAVGDGNLSHPATRSEWIAFRRWVTHYRGNDFRVLGTPERTWDWPHVEVPSGKIGFRSIDQALAAGRACLSGKAERACEFEPHLLRAN
ncbi:MAG TPA: hypothetical protein VE052_00205 [Gemmatimonadaceae bacterium]|nr:hypothetical protein [Gemmatimonadaceae bacterium]